MPFLFFPLTRQSNNLSASQFDDAMHVMCVLFVDYGQLAAHANFPCTIAFCTANLGNEHASHKRPAGRPTSTSTGGCVQRWQIMSFDRPIPPMHERPCSTTPVTSGLSELPFLHCTCHQE